MGAAVESEWADLWARADELSAVLSWETQVQERSRAREVAQRWCLSHGVDAAAAAELLDEIMPLAGPIVVEGRPLGTGEYLDYLRARSAESALPVVLSTHPASSWVDQSPPGRAWLILFILGAAATVSLLVVLAEALLGTP